ACRHPLHGSHRGLRRDRTGVGHVRHLSPGQDVRRRSRRVPAEDGFTLIEVLLTLAIMGLAMVAILGAMGTTIIGSTVHRRQADAGAVLLSAVERLKETSYDTSCITPPQAYLDAV